MDLNENDFLEELLETWETIPTEMNEFLSNGWSVDCYNENPAGFLPNSFFQGFSQSLQPNFDQSFNHFHHPFGDELSTMHINHNTPPFPTHKDYPCLTMENEEVGVLGDDLRRMEMQATCELQQIKSNEFAPVFNMGVCQEQKNRSKKVQGQPSKNLMAERRRRKRLNDRLLMLRSIVPKISKMDRTTILGDTIDYMKELLQRIQTLQEEFDEDGSNPINLKNISNDLNPNEITVRNSPKFDVARRNMDRRIEIFCAAKPGLLLSTVNTLESLGIEIQQCVISCFNDFAMQATCSEDLEDKTVISSEDLKQTLFRNAGYGGRCL